VRRLEWPRRLQAACAALGGDYGGVRLALLLLAPAIRRPPDGWSTCSTWWTNPLVRRFADLARVPTARTVSDWLWPATQETLRPPAHRRPR